MGHRYYDPLRLPLHLPGSLRYMLAHRYLASLPFVRLLQAGGRPPPCTRPSSIPIAPISVSLTRSWRPSRVPRLPLSTHAPLAVVGGVLPFSIAPTGLMPSSNSKLSAFPVTITGYPCYPYGPQLYDFRRSVTRPTHSLHRALHTTSWQCVPVRYCQGGYSCQAGLALFRSLTHWAT